MATSRVNLLCAPNQGKLITMFTVLPGTGHLACNMIFSKRGFINFSWFFMILEVPNLFEMTKFEVIFYFLVLGCVLLQE